MVRRAVRQAHGPERSRRTHHPEPCRRALSKSQAPMIQTGFDLVWGVLFKRSSGWSPSHGEPNRVDSLYSWICLGIGFCNLGFIWYLGFEIWNLTNFSLKTKIWIDQYGFCKLLVDLTPIGHKKAWAAAVGGYIYSHNKLITAQAYRKCPYVHCRFSIQAQRVWTL